MYKRQLFDCLIPSAAFWPKICLLIWIVNKQWHFHLPLIRNVLHAEALRVRERNIKLCIYKSKCHFVIFVLALCNMGEIISSIFSFPIVNFFPPSIKSCHKGFLNKLIKRFLNLKQLIILPSAHYTYERCSFFFFFQIKVVIVNVAL